MQKHKHATFLLLLKKKNKHYGIVKLLQEQKEKKDRKLKEVSCHSGKIF